MLEYQRLTAEAYIARRARFVNIFRKNLSENTLRIPLRRIGFIPMLLNMKIKNGNYVKVDGEWFLVIDCGIFGGYIKILRADSGERFEIQENEIEEWRN